MACHAWYAASYDSIYHNIIVPSPNFTTNGNRNAYDVQVMSFSGTNSYIDYNLFWNNGTTGSVDYAPTRNAGLDAHSQIANPNFVNAAAGDYRVATGSPALTLGFVNFPMDSFGRVNVPVDSLGSGCATGVIVPPARPASFIQMIFVQGDRVTVRYFLDMSERVEIDLLSMAGRKISTIFSGVENAGTHTAVWMQKRNSGHTTFLVRIRIGDRTVVKKMVAIR
jgi:hypothetical protein